MDIRPLEDDPNNQFLHTNQKYLSLTDVHLQVQRETNALIGPLVFNNGSPKRRLPMGVAKYFIERAAVTLSIMDVSNVANNLAIETAAYHATLVVEQGPLALSVEESIPQLFRTLLSTTYNSNTIITNLGAFVAHTERIEENSAIDRVLDDFNTQDVLPIIWPDMPLFVFTGDE